MMDRLLDKLGLQRKSKPEQVAQPVAPEKVTPPPANALEATVQQAPPIVTRLKKTEDELRQEALQTMAIMEAARADKGNFCLTLGSGDKRAVLLVAPIEGVQGTSVSPAEGNNPETTYTATRTDYFLLTAEGPRRVSFITHSTSSYKSVYTEDEQSRTRRAKEEQAVENRFKAVIDEAIKTDKPNLTDSNFHESRDVDGNVEYSLGLNSSRDIKDEKRIHRNVRVYARFNNRLEGISAMGIVTDENMVTQALQNSFQRVQAPLQARLDSSRAQIRSTGAFREGLK